MLKYNNYEFYKNELINQAFEIVDTNIFTQTTQQIVNDLANQADANNQALIVGQTIAVLGELVTGIPGDACAAAAEDLVDSYALGDVPNGTLGNYLGRLASIIDLIAQAATDPGSLRYSSGPRGNCAGGGRSYQFEAAWDSILSSADPYQLVLINAEYNAAKRLFSAFDIRSNNVGAAVTAASVPPVVQAIQQSLLPLTGFLNAIASGGNLSSIAGSAKNALLGVQL